MSQESTPYSNKSSVSNNVDEGAPGGTGASRQETAQPLRADAPLRATNQLIVHARTEMGRVISGQRGVVEEVMMAVLCQGHALRLCGIRGRKMGAAELAAVLRRRFPLASLELESDLMAVEEAMGIDALSTRDALRLVQLLERHQVELDAAARPAAMRREGSEVKTQERAS